MDLVAAGIPIPNRFCPICAEEAARENKSNGDKIFIECDFCGCYKITGTALAFIDGADPGKWNNLTDEIRCICSHWLFQQGQNEHIPLVTAERLKQVIEERKLPNVTTQLENALSYIGYLTTARSGVADIDLHSFQIATGSRNGAECQAIFQHLLENNLIQHKKYSTYSGRAEFKNVKLTVPGALEVEKLASGATHGKNAFMAMPFNNNLLDKLWVPGLRKAVSETGFNLERLDDKPEAGSIDARMRNKITAARFLIVELTDSNNGAYWEAGFAEGLGKPVIYTMLDQDGQRAHFDVDHSLRVHWTPETVDDDLQNLKAVIRNTLPDSTPDPELA